MTLRLPMEDWRRLRQIAFDREMPINALVCEAVTGLLSANEPKPWLVVDAMTGEQFRFGTKLHAMLAASDIQKRTKVGTTPRFEPVPTEEKP
jgi:hypothetical protein